jgi:hypothetical protein
VALWVPLLRRHLLLWFQQDDEIMLTRENRMRYKP